MNPIEPKRSIPVFYIDDEPSLVTQLSETLLPLGYQVVALPGWSEALPERLLAEGPQALILSHKPPLRDALRLLPRLRGGGLPPVIVLSNHDSAEVAVAALRAGAANYLVRQSPTFAQQLQETLAGHYPVTLQPGPLERQARHLAQVAAAGQRLAATLESSRVLNAVLAAATSILEAEDASIWVWESEARRQLVCEATSNQTLFAALRQQQLRPGEGIAGWVVAHGQSAIVADVQADHRFQRAIDAQTGFYTRSILAVPLRAREDVIGVLEVLNKHNDHFDPEDIAVAELLAGSAAVALENARLVEALRLQANELRARNEELDAFAHTVAHDLKMPLHWIAGFAELLYREGEQLNVTQYRDYLRSILNGAYMLGDIIDDLLLLASLRKPQAVLETISMSEVVDRVWERVGPAVEQYGAQLERPAQFPFVRAYGPWVEGVWVNYVTNAIQYGGRPPLVRLGFTENGSDFVYFWVEDNGPGLTEAQQAQLFQPYSRPGARHPHGHGLGLSIVRQIVEKLGGQVGVNSTQGGGSRFYFTLPRVPTTAIDSVGVAV